MKEGRILMIGECFLQKRERESSGEDTHAGFSFLTFPFAGFSFLTFPFAGSSFITFPFAGSSFITRTKKITEFLTLSRFYFGRGKPLCLPSADENLVR